MRLVAAFLAWLNKQMFYQDFPEKVYKPIAEVYPLENTVKPSETPPPPPSIDIEHSDEFYPDWDTPKRARHNVRVLCDLAGLTEMQKNLVTDICRCESQFNVHAKLVNNPKSIDRGLFQWNSYYHPEITDAIAYDPVASTKLAITAVKTGKAIEYWSASKPCWNKGGVYNSIIN